MAVFLDHFGQKADAALKGSLLFAGSEIHRTSLDGSRGMGAKSIREMLCVHTYMCTKPNVCVYVCTQRIAEILTYREFQINGLSSE